MIHKVMTALILAAGDVFANFQHCKNCSPLDFVPLRLAAKWRGSFS